MLKMGHLGVQSVSLYPGVVTFGGKAAPEDGVTGKGFAGPGSLYCCEAGVYAQIGLKSDPKYKQLVAVPKSVADATDEKA